MWIFEGLGDIPGFFDYYMGANMGAVSFFQMVYYTFITISTVGYGDYSPTTILSRTLCIVGIVGGVTYFSYATVAILDILNQRASGKGSFRPSRKRRYKKGRGHILVLGGGVNSGKSTVLGTFLEALCRDGTCPEVVLLTEAPISPRHHDVLDQDWLRRFKVHCFLGSPLSDKDLRRVRLSEASMVFVLSDFETENVQSEDRSNLLYAAHLQRAYPKVPFRLLLTSMPGLWLAGEIGLDVLATFSIESLKASLLASSVQKQCALPC